MRASAAMAGDRPPPPQLPLAQWWSVALDTSVSAGPVGDGERVYVALKSGVLTARDAGDGHEIWRQPNRDISAPMAVDGGRLIFTTPEAIEAVHGASGAAAWLLPRVKTVAPLLADGGRLFAVTDTEVLAIRAASGEVIWRRAAGGVRLPPVVDNDRLYVGADDGRVLALDIQDGSPLWERFFPGGVTAIAAHLGRVYVGAGDKVLYCLDGASRAKWPYRLGALAVGRISVDDDRVYVASMDNVVRALDRQSGNQRWQSGLRQRPSFGVFAAGHVVFVPVAASELLMLYDRNGRPSGSLGLPGDAPPGLTPSLVAAEAGPTVYAVTGGLTNEWSLTKFARAGDAALVAPGDLPGMPGLPYLTDPELMAPGRVLQLLLLGDPVLQPVADADWPIVLRDPALVPLTALPGLQLRPLSPLLPARRESRAPGA